MSEYTIVERETSTERERERGIAEFFDKDNLNLKSVKIVFQYIKLVLAKQFF